MITQVDSGRDDYFNTKKDANASFFMPIRDCQNLINVNSMNSIILFNVSSTNCNL